MRAVDLHLLPGVDDGARDEDAALEHARRMVAAGVTEATVTPHVSRDVALEVVTISARTAELQAALEREHIDLRLRPGGEVHPDRAAHGHELLGDAVLQANVDSLLGAHGEQIRRRAEAYVRSGRAYVVGSDGHPGTRDQTLGDGLDALLALGIRPARALRLVAANPAFLLRAGLPGVGRGALEQRARRRRGVELAGDDLIQ